MGWGTVTGLPVTIWRTEHARACHGWLCRASAPEVSMTHPLRDDPRTDPFAQLPREWGTRLRPLVAEFVDEVLNGLRRRAGHHLPPLAPEETEVLRRTVTVALHGFLDRVEHGTGTVRVDTLAAEFRALGEREARHGRGLECLHTGVRTATALTWRYLVVTNPASDEVLGPLGEAIFAFQEEISAAAAHGHSLVRGAEVDALRRRRSRLLEALLDEALPEERPRSIPALARAARWRMPEHVTVALLHREEAGGTTPVLAPDVLVDLERVEPCALIPDPEGPGRPRALERSLRGFHAVLGPTVPWLEASASLARARDLAVLVRRGAIEATGVVRWDDHLLALLLTHDTTLVTAMARSHLAPLTRLRDQQRERMAETLLAWFETGLNANEAAERLHIHPQTVRYRIRRMEELFGPRLRDPARRFELELVLRARRLLGPLED